MHSPFRILTVARVRFRLLLEQSGDSIVGTRHGKSPKRWQVNRLSPLSSMTRKFGVWRRILDGVSLAGGRLANWSMARQFIAVGGAVSVVALLLTGVVVTYVIERGITKNAAVVTALYVDSIIAPLLPDMRTSTRLDGVVKQALDETLGDGILGNRILEMRLWALDGTLLYSRNESLIGQRFSPSTGLAEARAGNIVANYNRFDALDDAAEPAGPLLEIYNPVLQPWSGEVVAIIEFYDRADDLESTLRNARVLSWAAVAFMICLFFASLSLIVLRGSRTITQQSRELAARLAQLSAMHRKVQQATQHASALNENYLRRLGTDLHDGPAQFIALAAMRLDSDLILGADLDPASRTREIYAIRDRLTEALDEIRIVCRGLVLPQIENADLQTVVLRSISEYETRTGKEVVSHIATDLPHVPISERICAYRFIQEGLNNSYRHADGASQEVSVETKGDSLSIAVSDRGRGFDPATISHQSLGIAGMRERVQSLGGAFVLNTSINGTTLRMNLAIDKAGEQ